MGNDVNDVVGVSVVVCASVEVGGTLPVIIDEKLELMLSNGDVNQGKEFVSVFVHRRFGLPIIPSAGDEDGMTAIVPGEDSGDESVIFGSGGQGEGGGRVGRLRRLC